MTLPNFFLIGAPRAGTTSLYHYLSQHPQIYLSPIKEPAFFCYDARGRLFDARGRTLPANPDHVRSRRDYEALFDRVRGEPAVGEASVQYLASPDAAARMAATIPSAKLVVVLRDPVARAYSSYLKYVRDGQEGRTFREAIADERAGRPERSPFGRTFYLSPGRYAEHLTRYLRHFKRDQLLLFLYEDVCADLDGVLRRVYRFLGVEPEFAADTEIAYNRAGVPRRKLLNSLLQSNRFTKAVRPWLLPSRLGRLPYGYLLRLQSRNLHQPPLDRDLHQELRREFHDDLLRLQPMIGRDLSGWLASPTLAHSG